MLKHMARAQQQGGQTNGRGRGFQLMDRERHRAISAEGGREAHRRGTAHEFTPDEARAAGSRSHSRRSDGR
jgi:uncharacterized protein